MKITFEIPDDSEAAEELIEIMSDSAITITRDEYCGNIVINFLNERVRQEYLFAAKRENISSLRDKFGSLSDIKIANRR